MAAVTVGVGGAVAGSMGGGGVAVATSVGGGVAANVGGSVVAVASVTGGVVETTGASVARPGATDPIPGKSVVSCSALDDTVDTVPSPPWKLCMIFLVIPKRAPDIQLMLVMLTGMKAAARISNSKINYYSEYVFNRVQ